MSTNIYFTLDNRKPDRLGQSPLKLRIMHNRKMADIPLNIRLHDNEWDKKNQRIKTSSKQFDNVTRINIQLQNKKASFLNQIKDLEEDGVLDQLNVKQLKERLSEKRNDVKTLYEFIQEQYDQKMSADKIGTARTYKDLENKLKKFSNKDLSFADIDYNFLQKLEHDHISKGNRYSSLSVYLRTLRALYNKAIKLGIAKKSHYPFDKYSIKNGEPKRSALTEGDFKKIVNADYKEGSALQIGRDYYLASFFLHGMNWMDMCYLTNRNFLDNNTRISYERRKTGKSFNIKVTEKLKTIIERLNKNKDKLEDDYIFPVLDKEDAPDHLQKKITNRRLKINKYLKKVAEDLKIEQFSIYSARHTYATMLWNKSGSASITQLSLGHKTEEQTQEYLSHFGNEKVDDESEDLFSDL